MGPQTVDQRTGVIPPPQWTNKLKTLPSPSFGKKITAVRSGIACSVKWLEIGWGSDRCFTFVCSGLVMFFSHWISLLLFLSDTFMIYWVWVMKPFSVLNKKGRTSEVVDSNGLFTPNEGDLRMRKRIIHVMSHLLPEWKRCASRVRLCLWLIHTKWK